MPTALPSASTRPSLVMSGTFTAALSAANFRSSGSEIAVNASRSTGLANSASGWKRSAMLAQSRRGIRRTMISVSRRVGSFQISRNRPSRTPSETRAAALFELKPGRHKYVRIDHDAFHAPSAAILPWKLPPQIARRARRRKRSCSGLHDGGVGRVERAGARAHLCLGPLTGAN
jgi:hypothetical protein